MRRVDEDLIDDLGRGILPDVVVCDLRSLVLRLLHDLDRQAAFLRNVGLVFADDAESFAGAVEIHAQLPFRRLKRVLRELQGVAVLGEESAPMFLILAVETMNQPETLIRDLCGIDAERTSYCYSEREARPGRGIACGKGRFVAVGLAAQEGGGAEAASLAQGDGLLKPTLIADVSIPRRRIRIGRDPEGNGDRVPRSSRLHFWLDLVHIGAHPIEVAILRRFPDPYRAGGPLHIL